MSSNTIKHYNNFQKDLSDSVIAMNKIIPILESKFFNIGKIYSIEDSDNNILKLLDMKCGIDYIRENEYGIQGIATRIQWGHPFNSFTIRSKRHSGATTELFKRQIQIKNGYFYPALTMQAYLDNRKENNLISCAFIKTQVLYNLLEENPLIFHEQKSDNKFLFVNWNDILNYIKVLYI